MDLGVLFMVVSVVGTIGAVLWLTRRKTVRVKYVTNAEQRANVARELRPFTSRTKNRWILELPGIEGYCVSAVKLPRELAASPRNKKVRSFGNMEVEFYDLFSDGQVNTTPLQGARAWLDAPMNRRAKLRFLDADGSTREAWTMDVRPVGLTHSRLAYAVDHLYTATLELNVSKLVVTAHTAHDDGHEAKEGT